MSLIDLSLGIIFYKREDISLVVFGRVSLACSCRNSLVGTRLLGGFWTYIISENFSSLGSACLKLTAGLRALSAAAGLVQLAPERRDACVGLGKVCRWLWKSPEVAINILKEALTLSINYCPQ
jgi:hypothetical protein